MLSESVPNSVGAEALIEVALPGCDEDGSSTTGGGGGGGGAAIFLPDCAAALSTNAEMRRGNKIFLIANLSVCYP